MQVRCEMRETTGKGWKMEIRLGNPEEKLLGEQILGVREVGKPFQETFKLVKGFNEKELQDVYFIFNKMDEEEQEQGSMRIIDFLLKAE